MFPSSHGVLSQGAGGGAPSTPKTGILNPGTLSTTDLGNWQVGWEFKVGASPITVIAGRLNAPYAVAGYTLKLWRVSDTTLIAETGTFTSVANTWVEEPFPTPIALSAGANYIIVVHRGGSTLAGTRENSNAPATATFASEITYVQGRHRLDGTSAFPSGTTANYARGLADIVFTT